MPVYHVARLGDGRVLLRQTVGKAYLSTDGLGHWSADPSAYFFRVEQIDAREFRRLRQKTRAHQTKIGNEKAAIRQLERQISLAREDGDEAGAARYERLLKIHTTALARLQRKP